MHVITGGAYNGKANWVKKTYELNNTSYTWLSAYKSTPCPEDLLTYDTPCIILEGVEQWIKKKIEEKGSTFNRDDGRVLIKRWLDWEKQDESHQLIIIGTDISKGIVPIKQEDRLWRDLTGWFYQDLVKHSERFDVIWYGINQQFK
ncbi:MAG TPA: bifunctional adenosylcobinamide kinase/adenosylcobinamide-phosphate guanylyltransferase [Candidatus Avamphibacillus sp.]|nr:bifunctional adenosylcobinamide kinase/adenosylcobinamide-phosphate guanylyltransferase [Candidatus Avamphibacillus sp.]